MTITHWNFNATKKNLSRSHDETLASMLACSECRISALQAVKTAIAAIDDGELEAAAEAKEEAKRRDKLHRQATARAKSST